MTSDQIGGIVRAILTFLAGMIPFFSTSSGVTLRDGIISGVVLIAVAVWSYYTNRPDNIVPKT